MLFIQNGYVQDISNLPSLVRSAIRRKMYQNKAAVSILFEWCDGIEDDMVNQYAFCNHGGIDIKPDYDSKTNTLNSEAWACPLRGHCMGEGVICVSTKEQRLSNMENKVLRHVYYHPDKAFKNIATDLGISKSTLDKHTTSIYRKIGIHSKPELLAKAITLNSII